ncbi:MAG TPA: hypothetical protein DD803_05620 [Alcaligenes faecalis]|nr:hypothetical protein [Alcaligenes faecalis]
MFFVSFFTWFWRLGSLSSIEMTGDAGQAITCIVIKRLVVQEVKNPPIAYLLMGGFYVLQTRVSEV